MTARVPVWKRIWCRSWSFVWFFALPAVMSVAVEYLVVDLGLVGEMAPWRIILFLAASAFVLLSVKQWLPFWSDPDLESEKNRKRLAKELARLEKRISGYMPSLERRIELLSRSAADQSQPAARTKQDRERLSQARKLVSEISSARADAREALGPGAGGLDEKAAEEIFARLRSAGAPARILPAQDSTFELVKVFGTAIVLAFLLRAVIVEPFRIPSASMVPTLQIGDHIFVNKYIYGVKIPYLMRSKAGVRPPGRGEVVVFQFPFNRKKDFIKRVIGLPGDTIELRAGVVHVNGKPAPRCKVKEIEYEDRDQETLEWEKERGVLYLEHIGDAYYTVMQSPYLSSTTWGPETVPEGKIFVMGDNRDHSYDSRSWGGVPFDLIKGRAFLIWWSNGPKTDPLRFDRMGHMLGSDPIMPKEFGPLLAPCLEKLRGGDAPSPH